MLPIYSDPASTRRAAVAAQPMHTETDSRPVPCAEHTQSLMAIFNTVSVDHLGILIIIWPFLRLNRDSDGATLCAAHHHKSVASRLLTSTQIWYWLHR